MLSQDPKGADMQTDSLGKVVLLVQADGTLCASEKAVAPPDIAAQWTGKSLFDLVPQAEQPKARRLLAAGLEFEVACDLPLRLEASLSIPWRVQLKPEPQAGQSCARMTLCCPDQVQLASTIDRDTVDPVNGDWASSAAQLHKDGVTDTLAPSQRTDSESMYRALLDNMQEGFAFCKMVFEEGVAVDFIYLDTNPSFFSLTGLGKVKGRKWTEVLPGVKTGGLNILETYARVVTTGKAESFERYIGGAIDKWFSLSICRPFEGHFFVIFDDISERKRNDEKLRSILAASPTGFALCRVSDEVYTDVNQIFLDMHGYERDEIVGHVRGDPPLMNDPEHMKHIVREVKERGYVHNRVGEYRHKSGRVGRAFASVELVELDGMAHVLVFVSDIAQLDQAHEALRASEARFRLLSAATFEGIAITRHGEFVDGNDQLLTMLRYARGEMLGKRIENFIPASHAEWVKQHIESGAASCIEHPVIRGDGSVIVVEAQGKTLERSDGSLRITAIRDVTERKKVEAALLTAHERFQSLFDSNVVGMWISEHSGPVIHANDYYLRILGYGVDELAAGQVNWKARTPDDQVFLDQRAAVQLRACGACMPYEKVYERRDGTRVTVLIALTVLSGGSDQVLGVALDITERVQVKQALQAANAELALRTREAEAANEAKSRFLSTVSHELRTPLHMMLGYLSLLRKSLEGEPLRQLKIVEQSGKHLLDLINDLLEFNLQTTDHQELQIDRIDVPEFLDYLENVGQMAASSSDNRFELLATGAIPARISGDELRLLQILQNLINNACKFTRNGQVTLRVHGQAEGERPGYHRLRFRVEDDGPGISPADQVHLFEPFYRSANTLQLPGMGLGLAIAQQWALAMEGRLTVHSQVGEGSCFEFSLAVPAADPGAADWLKKRRRANDVRDRFAKHLPALAAPVQSVDLHVAPPVVPAVQQQGPATALADPQLKTDEIAFLRELVRQGRVARIAHWAQAQMRDNEERRGFCLRLIELCQSANLPALEELVGRLCA